jgi:predicted ABC-type ATPase
MPQKKMYIIAGCNGAGKTTASFNILPSILECQEFVNADEIARGLSPFQPEKVAIEAGRIMLHRISELLELGEDFAFETTLSTKSFVHTIKKAREKGYSIHLLFFWLESPELAIKRVHNRVMEGGHNIPEATILRRYFSGVKNLFSIYLHQCDLVILYDNSKSTPQLIMEKNGQESPIIHDSKRYERLIQLSK